jgi:hypothetical protein
MSRPSDKLRQPTVSDQPPVRARVADAGIARGPGLAVAGVTAAVVFVIGQQLFPVRPRQEPPPPAPIVATPPPVVAPPVVDAAVAAAAEAGTATKKVVDAGAAVAELDKTAEPSTADEAAADRKPIDKQRQADRDLAREAWRRNRPDISVTGNKTSVMVPIKGSIKGADFKILKKSRTVLVTLPRAVSMVTMRVYNLKHPSFKKLWIDQEEANAQPANGTKLRLILSQTFDPQVEINEDFVRVTIRRPEPAADAPAKKDKDSESRSEKQDERPEKHGDKAEKHGDKAEKRSEPSEETTPPPAKESD